MAPCFVWFLSGEVLPCHSHINLLKMGFQSGGLKLHKALCQFSKKQKKNIQIKLAGPKDLCEPASAREFIF